MKVECRWTQAGRQLRGHFDVSKLHGPCEDDCGGLTPREAFMKSVCGRLYPECFLESSHVLEQIFEERNRLYVKWLG